MLYDKKLSCDSSKVFRNGAYSDLPEYLKLLRECIYGTTELGIDELELRLAEVEKLIESLELEKDTLTIALKECDSKWIKENSI